MHVCVLTHKVFCHFSCLFSLCSWQKLYPLMCSGGTVLGVAQPSALGTQREKVCHLCSRGARSSDAVPPLQPRHRLLAPQTLLVFKAFQIQLSLPKPRRPSGVWGLCLFSAGSCASPTRSRPVPVLGPSRVLVLLGSATAELCLHLEPLFLREPSTAATPLQVQVQKEFFLLLRKLWRNSNYPNLKPG